MSAYVPPHMRDSGGDSGGGYGGDDGSKNGGGYGKSSKGYGKDRDGGKKGGDKGGKKGDRKGDGKKGERKGGKKGDRKDSDSFDRWGRDGGEAPMPKQNDRWAREEDWGADDGGWNSKPQKKEKQYDDWGGDDSWDQGGGNDYQPESRSGGKGGKNGKGSGKSTVSYGGSAAGGPDSQQSTQASWGERDQGSSAPAPQQSKGTGKKGGGAPSGGFGQIKGDDGDGGEGEVVPVAQQAKNEPVRATNEASGGGGGFGTASMATSEKVGGGQGMAGMGGQDIRSRGATGGAQGGKGKGKATTVVDEKSWWDRADAR